MGRIARLVGVVGGLVALWIGWGLYVRETTERIEYTTLRTLDGVEIRRYPAAILAETTAPDSRTAFGRLYQYITGTNAQRSEIEMTAPVRTESARIAMTTPVRSSSADDGVTMGFYLPQEYDGESAPVPTDPSVDLVLEEPKTVAVRPFSWYATDERVERYERDLLETLAAHDLEPAAEPFVLQYNDPFTPPFLRRNEVGVVLE
ncbi:SOUL family heme-binding protein [Natribaculum luteum]|uniref:SOUL family heme-binding protein n=1 Tax=Natribaculum luteum TaxID=1586232 RepID=A0ABD5P5G3_9EURY|nr:heme-binding protein [Natribaculum luteum]